MQKNSLLLPLIVFILFAAVFQGCKKDPVESDAVFSTYTKDYSSEVANTWSELSLDLTKKTSGFVPPIASRAYGYLGITLYESVVEGMPRYQTLSGKLSGYNRTVFADASKKYYYPACANAALALMTKRMFANASPENLIRIDALEQSYNELYLEETSAEILENSKTLGKAIAEEIYQWSVTDGGNEAYNNLMPSDYVIPQGTGFWVPTPPAFDRPLLPYWGNKRTLVDNVVGYSQPKSHVSYSTLTNSEFHAQAMEVYTTVNNLATEQSDIAKYWADNPGETATPGGHSWSILKQLLKSRNENLDFAAQAYAKMGIALSDAFVSCWKCKYHFNLMRPVTYIQENIDADWLPILGTPNFPEYSSGHSVQSGAMAVVLNNLFGSSYVFTDSTHMNRTDINGTPRRFSSFDAAAKEAAISRLYGGIHYADAIVLGVEQGRKVGFKAITLGYLK